MGLKRNFTINMGRPFNKCNWIKYREALAIRLDNIQIIDPHNTAEIDHLVAELTQAIQDALDEVCPLQPVKSFRYTLSREILDLIRTKRKIR